MNNTVSPMIGMKPKDAIRIDIVPLDKNYPEETVLPETKKDGQQIVDSEEQNWFKRTHIGQYLGIACIITSTATLSEEDIRSRAFLQAEVGIHSMDPIRKEDTQYHFADWCPLCRWKLSKR